MHSSLDKASRFSVIWSTTSIHLQNLAVNIYLFKITVPIPAWLLLKIERCFDNFRKSSTSCCFWPFGFGKWKTFASVLSSGAESKSNPSHRSSNSDSKSKIIHIFSSCYTLKQQLKVYWHNLVLIKWFQFDAQKIGWK